MTPPAKLRLGSRGSLLARAQSEIVVADLQRAHPQLDVDLCIIATTGDRLQQQPLHELGGKGLFTKELELALLDGTIDLAVHSFKDVPVTMPLVAEAQEKLLIAAAPKREDPWDALISTTRMTVDELPPNARVGTDSLRRRCQLLARRPDLRIEPLRGNIDTRLKKLRGGEYEAIVLAVAGLKRAKLFDPAVMIPIAEETMLPAAGQGALALQCRADDPRVRQMLAPLNDPDTADCVAAERALVRALNGDCTSPIAALATIASDQLTLRGAVGTAGGGQPVCRASVIVARNEPQRAGQSLADALGKLT